MYDSKEINKFAPRQDKKEVIQFVENNLQGFQNKLQPKEINSRYEVEIFWIEILERLIDFLKTSKKRKIQCYLTITSIRIAAKELQEVNI